MIADTSYTPLTDVESSRILLADKSWSDDYALKVSMQDFNAAEQHRTSNMDFRWATADQLYLAWGATKFWEGTRIPRSNIPNYTVFEQIESMIPKIVGAVFADWPNWFQASPRPGTKPDEVRAVQSLIMAQMDNLPRYRQATVREVLRRGFKSGFLYGNGLIEIYQSRKKEQRIYTYRKFRPEIKMLTHPQWGQIRIPTGRMKSEIKRVPFEEKINQPFMRHIDIRDFYIDPLCSSPLVADSRFCAVRRMMPLDEVISYRDVDDFNVPEDDDLIMLSRRRPNAQADFTKKQTDLYRQMWWQPEIDTTSDAAGKNLEIIEYTTRARKVWVINRCHVMYNKANEYGFLNYYDIFYCDVPGRFYGLAISDVCEGEQRLQKAIIDARIDELALSLNKPMIKRRGLSIPAYQLKVRPGQMIEADNPREDILPGMAVNNVTQEAYIEVQASDVRVQKITGGSDLAILGTPSSGGNSANRTATGVGAQVQATGTRVQYHVENSEDCVIEQLLGDWLTLNQKFLDPNEVINILGPDGKNLTMDPLTVINAQVKFSMRASAKMASRQALSQNFPLVLQTLMNPGLMQQLRAQGQTINFVELEQMLFDMLVHQPVSNLIRPMTQQEQQMMQQPPPEAMLKKQMQDDRMAGQQNMASDKQVADLVRTVLKGIMDHGQNDHSSAVDAAQQLRQLVTGKAMDHMTAVATMPPEPSEPQETGGE